MMAQAFVCNPSLYFFGGEFRYWEPGLAKGVSRLRPNAVLNAAIELFRTPQSLDAAIQSMSATSSCQGYTSAELLGFLKQCLQGGLFVAAPDVHDVPNIEHSPTCADEAISRELGALLGACGRGVAKLVPLRRKLSERLQGRATSVLEFLDPDSGFGEWEVPPSGELLLTAIANALFHRRAHVDLRAQELACFPRLRPFGEFNSGVMVSFRRGIAGAADDLQIVGAEPVFRPEPRETLVRLAGATSAYWLETQRTTLPLSELVLSVENDSLTLSRRSDGERIIVRPSNSVAQTVVEEFLQAMGRQAVGEWSTDWSGLAGVELTPRLRFGRCVLSPAVLRLDGRRLQRGSEEQHLRECLRRADFEGRVLEVEGKRCAHLDEVIDAGRSVLLKNGKVEIFEVLSDGEIETCFVSSPHLRREGGRSRSLQHAHVAVRDRRAFPGSARGQLRFFASPTEQDEVVSRLATFLERAGFRGWSFGRQGTPHPHLIFQFVGVTSSQWSTLLEWLRESAQHALPAVTGIQIDTHELELERYGGLDGCALFEQLSAISTRAAVKLLGLREELSETFFFDAIVAGVGVLATTIWPDDEQRSRALAPWIAKLRTRVALLPPIDPGAGHVEASGVPVEVSLLHEELRLAAAELLKNGPANRSDEIGVAVLHHHVLRLVSRDPLATELLVHERGAFDRRLAHVGPALAELVGVPEPQR